MKGDGWRPPRTLDPEFYRRSAELVAPELLGKVLWSCSAGGIAAVRIVETEAYGGGEDPGSHGYRGMTKRNAVMFGHPGNSYIYFTYGMHYCLNVVTDEPGVCSAVLIRAGEPVVNCELMAKRRGRQNPLDLASGPAKLTQALGLTTEQNCLAIDGSAIGIGDDSLGQESTISTGPRVGISEGLHLDWRFAIADNPFVSRPAPSKV